MTLPTYGMDTTTALWPDRWPLIYLDSCIDEVEAAPSGEKEAVRWSLPCDACQYNTQCLTGKLKEVGALMYDREYLTRPRSSQSSLFPYDRMEQCFDWSLSLVEGYRKPVGVEDRYAVCSGWDLAWSERAGGDYLCVFTSLLDRLTGKKRVLDIQRWQRKTFEEQVNMIDFHYSQYRDDLVVIETDMSQIIWKQYIEGNTNVPVIGHSAGKKSDLQEGVPILLRDIDARKWEIPMAQDGLRAENVRVWLSEAEAFGWQDDKLQGVGEHDDTVMAWYHSDWGLERMRIPGGYAPQGRQRNTRRGKEF